MFKIRSSRVFQLLCWAIGLLALALLAMVGVMVYPLVFGQKEAPGRAGPAKPRATVKAAETAVAQAASSWSERFWPTKQDDTNAGFDPNPVDTFSGLRFLGSILENDGKGYAYFQREGGNTTPLLVKQDSPHAEVKIRKLSKDMVAIQIGTQKATLRKVEAGLPRTGPKRPAGVASAPTGAPPVPVTPVGGAATSHRLANSGTTGASSSPSATMAAASGTTPGATGVNWRQYWNERIRRQQEQAGQRR